MIPTLCSGHSDFGGTNSNTTVQYDAFFDTGNGGTNLFSDTGTAVLIGSSGSQGTSSFSYSGTGPGVGNDYSLTQRISITGVNNIATRILYGANAGKYQVIHTVSADALLTGVPVPEPTTAFLIAFGLSALALISWSRAKATNK